MNMINPQESTRGNVMNTADEQHIAKKCADNIRKYWAERGQKVRIKTALNRDGRNGIWILQSDMIDGLPRGLKRRTSQ